MKILKWTTVREWVDKDTGEKITKEKVVLHGFERSTHDMGYLWRSTMSAGTLVPFMSQVGITGDTWDIT